MHLRPLVTWLFAKVGHKIQKTSILYFSINLYKSGEPRTCTNRTLLTTSLTMRATSLTLRTISLTVRAIFQAVRATHCHAQRGLGVPARDKGLVQNSKEHLLLYLCKQIGLQQVCLRVIIAGGEGGGDAHIFRHKLHRHYEMANTNDKIKARGAISCTNEQPDAKDACSGEKKSAGNALHLPSPTLHPVGKQSKHRPFPTLTARRGFSHAKSPTTGSRK